MSDLALKVGSLYGELTLDSSKFDRGLQQSGQRFESLTSLVATGVKTIAAGFAGATTTVAGLGVSAFKIGVDFNRLQQNSRSALATILGSAEAAADQMDRLDDFASNSPFARQVWITAQQQLLGFGVEAQRVVPILDAVQQAVAAVGGGNEQIESVTYALAQMQGTGRLTGQTLTQLGQYGINAAEIIGEQMGKSGQEIAKLASKPGGIPVDQIWDPFVDGLMKSFDSATDGLRQQWDGAVDRVKAAWRTIGSILAEPFIDPMGGGRAVDWANDFANTLRAGEAKIRPLVDLLVQRFNPALSQVSIHFKTIQGYINSFDVSKVNRQLDQLSRYTPLIAGVATAMFSLGTQSIPLIGAINPVVAGFAALAATSPEVRRMLGDFGASVQPLLPMLGTLGVQLADTAMLAIQTLAPALGELLVAGGDLAVSWGRLLIPAAGDLLAAGTPLIEMLADLLRWIAELPGPVQAAMLAFVAMNGPLGDFTKSVQGGVKNAFETLRDTSAVQRALSDAGEKTTLLGTAAAGASGFVKGLGNSLKTAFIANAPMLAITAVVTALTYFATQSAEARREADELQATLDEQTGALTDNSRAWAANRAQKEGLIPIASDLGISSKDLTSALLGEEEQLRRVEAAIEARARANAEALGLDFDVADAQKHYTADMQTLVNWIGRTNSETVERSEAQRELAEAIGTSSDADRDAASAADEHRAAQEALRRELEEQIDTTLSAAEATLRQDEAILRATEAVEAKRKADEELERVLASSTATEEERTDAQRAAERAARDADQASINLTKSTNDVTAALGRNNASYEELRAEMQRARDAFIEQRIQMGDTRAAAEALADEYGLIPSRVDTMVHLTGVQEALNQIGNLDQTLNNINGKTVRASVVIRQEGQAAIASGGYAGDFAAALGLAGGGTPKRFPHGGQVLGAGTPTSDSIPAWLSHTEFVQRAFAVQKYGVDAMYALNAGHAPRDVVRAAIGLADGGMAERIEQLGRRWVPVPSSYAPPSGGSTSPQTSQRIEVTATLTAEDRELLRAVADRPLEIDGRVLIAAVRRADQRYN